MKDLKALNTHTFTLSNMGVYLNAAKDNALFRVTHAGLYAQSTDALLNQTGGFIAQQINGTNYTVAASLIASTPLDRPAPKGINPALPFVVSVDGKDFQVAGFFIVNPDNVEAARHAANAFMMENEGTSLIDSSEYNEFSEVETIHIIVHNAPMAA